MIEAMNIPKLRFPEFIGEWKEKRLGDIGDFKGGGTPSKSVKEYWHGDIPWISSSDINEQDIHNIKISKFINEVAIKESATKIIPKESVLFISRVGVGKLAINTKEVCTSQDFTSLLPKNTSSYFLGYFFLAKNNLLIRYSQGTSIKGFTKKDIEALRLNIPTEPEQQKIATFLTEVDNKIEQLSKKQELLGEYKKGLMQQIFSQAIRFKADDGSDYADWEEKRLGDVSIRRASNISANQLEDNNGDYKIYGAAGHLKNINFYTEEDCYVAIVKDGAGVGRTMLLESKTSVLGTLAIIKAKQGNDISFLYWLIQTINFRKYVVGSTIPHIYYRDYQAEKLRIPSFPEQTKIASFLSSVDTTIVQLSKQLDEYKQFKKALLQQMFV